MKKVIIDTDIGGDIDDALAVSLALNSPEIEVIGITTVFVDTTSRAKLTKKLLSLYNRLDIPVIKGAEKPLIGDWDKNLIPLQAQAVKDDIEINEGINVIDFIVDTIMSSTERITLIPIGPLTNIAGAIIKEPRLIEKTEIYMMGGMYSQAFPEWNIYCDPEAARIVFDSGIKITMVGLDVTLKCRLNRDGLDKIFNYNSERTKFLSELIKIWQEGNIERYPILHDPLAIASFIDPTLVRKENMHIKVETKGEFTRGVTVVTDTPYTSKKGESNVDVCIDVDNDRFINFFLNRILK